MEVVSATRILVIDDESAICMSLTAFLEDSGFKTSFAKSAEDALELMKKNTYDVCIVDLRLPGMSGEDLILQASAHYPRQRYMIYTGSISYSLPDQLLEYGIRPEHVFFKPIRVLSLLIKGINRLTTENSNHAC